METIKKTKVIITAIKSNVPSNGLVTVFTLGYEDFISRRFVTPAESIKDLEQAMVTATPIELPL